MIGRDGERRSGISVQAARHGDDDDSLAIIYEMEGELFLGREGELSFRNRKEAIIREEKASYFLERGGKLCFREGKTSHLLGKRRLAIFREGKASYLLGIGRGPILNVTQTSTNMLN